MNKLKSSAKNIALTPTDDLFSSEESRADANRERVVELPLTELHPFKNHPFKVLDATDSEQATPSIFQALRLKKFSQEGRLSIDVMRAVMSEEKKSELDRIILTGDKVNKYSPDSYTPQQKEQVILKLLAPPPATIP